MPLSCTVVLDETPGRVLPLEESEAPPRLVGSWPVAGDGGLRLEDGRLWLGGEDGEWLVADQVIGVPAINAGGDRLVYCRQTGGETIAVLEAWEWSADGSGGAWLGPRVLVRQGDRPALSPDGQQVAYVSGDTGVASLWVMPFGGGGAVQLTNVDLDTSGACPGQPPAGFVDPPHRGPPRFDGDRLVWDAPDGPHAVALP